MDVPRWDAPRNGRVVLRLPVLFRTNGENRWHVGTTEHVSPSGLTIRTGELPAAGSPIDVVVALPPAGLKSTGCLRGRGRVIGVLGPTSQTDKPAFAVTVPRLRLEQLQRALDALGR